MPMTKIDKIVEKIEQEATTSTPVDVAGDEVVVTTPVVTDAQTPETTAAVNTPVNDETNANENNADNVKSFNFEEKVKELESLIQSTPITPTTPEEVVPEETIGKEENENFRTLYSTEVQKRVSVEGKLRESAAELDYYKTLVDKQSNKQYEIIDKQKEMEVMLRRAEASATPEDLTHLSESYSLWKESGTPNHKYRAVLKAVEVIQNITGVSGENYLHQIFASENKDLPEVPGVAPVSQTPDTPQKSMPIGF